MKDILVLLVLLNTQTIKVCSQPYKADSNGECLNSTTEYLLDEANLCCKKCPPGQRRKQECTETTETLCEPCPAGQHMESWNYSPNCLLCAKCKSVKGLRNIQNCSSTTRSLCGCRPGMYCIMDFDEPYCSECRKYKQCKPGYGVSTPGTADSDVRCMQCSSGTFSDTHSSTDRCRPHTNCHGRVVVRKGNSTSDTKCGPVVYSPNIQPHISTKEPHTEIASTAASTMMSTVLATSVSKSPRGPSDSTPTVSEAVFSSTKNPPPSTASDSTLVAVIVGAVVVIVLLIIFILLFLCKRRKKDPEKFHPKVDANGNCETIDKVNQGYLVETQVTSFTGNSPEQQCLLEKGEACSEQSQCSSNTETSTRTTDGYSSYESIGPLQPTIALHDPRSALSEPLTLLSNTESVTSQTSIPTQSSSQPTSPQNIRPMTTSPHVNVNITFNIGNGSCGTQSVIPADLMQVDSKLPFGEEEESFSIPQQEDGKQSLMSVQESASYSI